MAKKTASSEDSGSKKPSVSKCAAGYGSASTGFSCSACMFFRPPRSCKIVQGKIVPSDCCNLFDNTSFKPACTE